LKAEKHNRKGKVTVKHKKKGFLCLSTKNSYTGARTAEGRAEAEISTVRTLRGVELSRYLYCCVKEEEGSAA
jgi:hypothetical protein